MMTNPLARRSCLIRFFKRAPILSMFLIMGLFPFTANAFDILLGTRETGSFSHFTGRTVCRILNKYAVDIDCKTVPASGDVHNLTNLQDGSLDMGLIDSRMLHDAVNKSGSFKFLDINYDDLRPILSLYDVPVTLVVRSDAGITSLAELKEKRMNAGAPGSVQRLAVDTIMRAKNWSKGDFRLLAELPTSQSQDTMAFCHGTIQAMVHVGVHPDSSLQQLFRLCEAGLVDMDDEDIEKLIKDHPAFSKIDIAAETYPSQLKEIATFGTSVMLVASEDLDEQIVYKIIDAVYRNRQRLKRTHPAIMPLSEEGRVRNHIGLKLHPGAVKYFLEHGM